MTTTDNGVTATIAAHPAWERLEGQREYYSARSNDYQSKYKRIKLTLIGLAAAMPLLAFLPGEWAKYLVAFAGIAIALLEGLLMLNQYGQQWVRYRGTCEALKRERVLLLSRAADYKGLADDDALRLLAERVEALLDVEHREWTDDQKKALEQLAKARDWAKAQLEQQDKDKAEDEGKTP